MNKEKTQLRSTALRRGNKAGTGLLLSLLSLSLAAAPLAAYAGPDATASAVMQDGHVMVKGRIVDANGEAIIGANVVEEGTANGTITDFDGYFSLKVAQGARLVISYVGYTSQTVDAKPDMKITLREDSELLGEVVVTAHTESGWCRADPRQRCQLYQRFARQDSRTGHYSQRYRCGRLVENHIAR